MIAALEPLSQSTAISPFAGRTFVEDVIRAWLASHESDRTAGTYAAFLCGWRMTGKGIDGQRQWAALNEQRTPDFRSYFAHHAGGDILLPAAPILETAEAQMRWARLVDEHHKAVLKSAEAWAALPKLPTKSQRTPQAVSAGTQNVRLAAVASFYTFAIRHGDYAAPNPLDVAKRAKYASYTHVEPLAFAGGEIDMQLAAITTSTKAPRTRTADPREQAKAVQREMSGMRDRALLELARFTGARLSEISGLLCQELTIAENGDLHIRWERLKGGKRDASVIEADCPAAVHVLRWLKRYYGSPIPHDDRLVFVSLSRNHKDGRLTAQAVEQIAKKWIGSSRFHRIRHTFAVGMKEAGASDHDVMRALHHTSLAVTTRYLAAATDDHRNAHLTALRDVYAGRAPKGKATGRGKTK